MYSKNKLITLSVVLILFSNPLYAYLDPGTLSYLVSIIIGALVGILMYIKIIWAKIIQLVHKMKNRGITNEDD
jgi:hypothetical protein